MAQTRVDHEINQKLFDLAVEASYRQFNQSILDGSASVVQSDADAVPAYPADLDERVLRLIGRERRKARQRRLLRGLQRVAVIILVVLLCATGALMTVEAFREATVRTLIEWSDKIIQIILAPDPRETTGPTSPSVSGSPDCRYQPAWLPEGLKLDQDVSDDAGAWRMMTYQSEDGLHLSFYQTHLQSGGLLAIDRESATSQETTIRGLPAILVTRVMPGDGEIKLWWKDDKTSFMISTNLDLDHLVRVAENIVYAPEK